VGCWKTRRKEKVNNPKSVKEYAVLCINIVLQDVLNIALIQFKEM
jgi:hypothetical protein